MSDDNVIHENDDDDKVELLGQAGAREEVGPKAQQRAEGLVEGARRLPLCLYHADCVDGFTAAWAVAVHLKGEVELRPAAHGQPGPKVEELQDRDVYVVDFSYSQKTMQKIIDASRRAVILDHHKSAEPALSALKPKAGDLVVYDVKRSGAGLAWDELMREPRPHLISYVEDADLFTFRHPWSREVRACIRSFAFDLRIWDGLSAMLANADAFKNVVLEGGGIERMNQKQCAELAQTYARPFQLGEHLVRAANVPHYFASDVGHLLAANQPFGVVYWDSAEGRRIFSLRSRADGLDVAEVAENYGGGGHARAAGFSLPAGVEWEGPNLGRQREEREEP